MTPTSEHVEASMEGILRAVSEMSLSDVQTAAIALQAGWLDKYQREGLEPLSLALEGLLDNFEEMPPA